MEQVQQIQQSPDVKQMTEHEFRAWASHALQFMPARIFARADTNAQTIEDEQVDNVCKRVFTPDFYYITNGKIYNIYRSAFGANATLNKMQFRQAVIRWIKSMRPGEVTWLSGKQKGKIIKPDGKMTSFEGFGKVQKNFIKSYKETHFDITAPGEVIK
jgi:hypothetical protein